MKAAQGGGKSFMNWYLSRLAAHRSSTDGYLELINAATYSPSVSDPGREFVARFDGVWQLGGYGGVLGAFEKFVSQLKNRRLAECYSDCTKVIFQSSFSRNSAHDAGLCNDGKPETVICNPIRSQEQWSNQWSQSRSAFNSTRIIKMVSYHRHTPLKCSYLAPEIAEEISLKFGLPVELVVIGNAHKITDKYISQAIRRPRPASVNVRRIEGNIDIFVKEAREASFVLNLAHFDPCPNVVCEAAGFGIPQIVVRSGGIPEILGDNYPYFIEEFAKNRSWLKKNDLDLLDWDSLFGVVDNVLAKGSHTIYESATQNHNPDSVFSRYQLFSKIG